MIQSTGKIKVNSPEESEAAQRALFAKGILWWSDGAKKVRAINEPFLFWDNEGILHSQSDRAFENSKYTLHTLSDFNLLPGGEPMLSMDDIEVGGRYLVRRGIKTGTGPKNAVFNNAMRHLEGTIVTVSYVENGHIHIEEDGYILGPQMLQRRVDKTEQQPAHEYKFGDKVKTHRHEPKPRYYIGSIENVTYTSDIDPASFFDFSVKGTSSVNISPWPEPVTVQIGLDPEYGPATVHPEGIKVGCQVIRFEAFDKLAAEVAKIRGNDQ